MKNAGAFRRALLRWYDRAARELPWRRTSDPYRIWVSEVMLQQTRVAVVEARYRSFLRRFPTVRTLAAAPLSAVLAEWSGLGYYRRARNLRAAARAVMKNGGRLPRTLDDWRALPGVGRYTAAAVASIAHGEPVAVVDGNVERVLARLAGPSEQFDPWSSAQSLLDPARPGDFNQAMMELGAIVCLPQAPLCGQCPVARWCATRGALPRAAATPRRKHALAYALARSNGSIRLVRRPETAGVMPGMYELPALEVPPKAAPSLRLRHSIMQTDYDVAVYAWPSRRGRAVPLTRLAQLPLTGLTRKVLLRAGLLI